MKKNNSKIKSERGRTRKRQGNGPKKDERMIRENYEIFRFSRTLIKLTN